MINIFADKISDGCLELKFKKIHKTKILDAYAQECIFEIFLIDEEESVGLIKLRPKLTPEMEEYGGHIEYKVDEKFRGNNYAAKSCFLLFPILKRLNINPIIITCDPSNIPSVKTCEKIGAKLVSKKEIEILPGKKRLTSKYVIKL
jgi:tagatose 1,6-diphosphate aldolase